MRKKLTNHGIAIIGIAVFVFLAIASTATTPATTTTTITPTGSVGTTLSGTYYFGSTLYITFRDNTFTRTMIGEIDSGTYRISGNRIIFSQSMWGSNTWTIVDQYTLRDPDGDLWKKEAMPATLTTLSGTYYFGPTLYFTFRDNTYTRTMSSGTDSGTYRISGNRIIFSQSMWGSNTWTIVDRNTLLDPDGDLWVKE
jgi:hypothetical protein